MNIESWLQGMAFYPEDDHFVNKLLVLQIF